jgi:hypothetical protein
MVVADPDEALIEAIEAAIDNATDAPFCPHDGLEHVCHCNTCAARAAYAAMVEHLGMVEERRYVEPIRPHPEPTPTECRLVSRWEPQP